MLEWRFYWTLGIASLCKCKSSFFGQVATRRVIRCACSHAHCNRQEAEGHLPEELFSNPSEYAHNWLDKRSAQQPDLRHSRRVRWVVEVAGSAFHPHPHTYNRLRIERDLRWLYKPWGVHSRLVTFNVRALSGLREPQHPSLVESSSPDNALTILCEEGRLEKALDVLLYMEQQGRVPSAYLYTSLLKVCAKRRALDQTKHVHLHLAKHGLVGVNFLGESVVRTLIICGGLDDALQVFHRLPKRTSFSWTAVISGYTNTGQCQKALKMYDCMRGEGLKPNKYTFVSLLKACTGTFDLRTGKRIHDEASRFGYGSDLFVGTCLVDMYAKCGNIVDARNVFDTLPQRDVVAWTAMISAYIQQREPSKALELYGQMRSEGVTPDGRIFVSALQACSMLAAMAGNCSERIWTKMRALEVGRAIHGEAWSRGFKSDIYLANTLMSMYGRCGSMVDAFSVFHGLSQRDVVSWNVMILACAQDGQPDKALHLYGQMLQGGNTPDARTFVGALQACCMLNEGGGRLNKLTPLECGKIIHTEAWKRGYKTDVFVGSSLVLMYSDCGSIDCAQSVFDGLCSRDVVLWNAMVAAYAQKGEAEKALELYDLMQEVGVSPDVRTFVSALQACSMLAESEEDALLLDGQATKVTSLERARKIHATVFWKGCEADVFVSNTLISLYGKCGSIFNAQDVFVGMSERDKLSWNAVAVAHLHQGQPMEVLRLFEEMLVEGVSPHARTFVCALQACGMLAGQENDLAVGEQSLRVGSFSKGKAIHAESWSKGHESDVFVSNALISMYGKCRSIVDAHSVFHGLNQQEATSWNMILAAYVHHGKAEKALQLFEQMLESGPTPNRRTVVISCQACGMLAEEDASSSTLLSRNVNFLAMGKALHFIAWSLGYKCELIVENSILTMYTKCGSILDAENMFDELSKQTVESWNAMISAHAIQADNVLQLYEQMLEDGVDPDDRTFVSVLHACAVFAEHEEEAVVNGQWTKINSLHKGKAVHADLWSRGCILSVYIGNTLTSMYGKCRSIVDAQIVFDGLYEKDVVSWNAMLALHAQQGHPEQTLEMYKQMKADGVNPDACTFVTLLQALGILAEKEDGVDVGGVPTRVICLQEGKTIQAEVWRMGYERNVFISNTLISMYGKCGSILDAQAVFDRLHELTVVSWNAMLAAYATQHQAKKVFELYEQMSHEGVIPDDRTYVSLLQTCGMLAEEEDTDEDSTKVKALETGKALQAAAWANGYKSDVFIGNTLISMYGKCGSFVDAQYVLNGLSQCGVVSWNSILTAYAQQGQEHQAFNVYKRMLEEGVSTDDITLVCILQACSKTGCLDLCRQIHHNLISTLKYVSPLLASSLIHAYGRCAGIVEAESVFELLPQPDVVSWNALCASYARHGNWQAILGCYNKMQLAQVKPNEVTFLSLLSACSHAGLVDEGVDYFNSMTRDYSISPETEHYASMIDLLGRAGHFTMVEDMLSTMPMQPNLSVWLCLLGACRKYGNVEVGKRAFDHAVRLQPNHGASYVLMSNIYSQAGMWDIANEVNRLRLRAGAWKKPGQSWIKHEQQIHTFVVGDSKHQQDIHLRDLIEHLRLSMCFRLNT